MKAIVGVESWETMQARALDLARRIDAGDAVAGELLELAPPCPG